MAQAKARAGGIIRESLDNSWRTPERILERVRVYFGGPIPLDPASGPDNPTRALTYYTGEEPSAAPEPGLFRDEVDEGALTRARRNGLAEFWAAPVFCNPPYGSELNAWLAKMSAQARAGTTIITLLPCTRFECLPMTGLLAEADALCLIRGRVAFISSLDGQAVSGNTSASMLVGLNVVERRWLEAFGPLGSCYSLSALGWER